MTRAVRSTVCRSWAVAAAIAGLVAVLPAAAGQQEATALVTGPVKTKQVCMLNNYVIKVDKEGMSYLYKGNTYYFCCTNCVRQFASNPDALSKATDPVNDQKVDKAKARYYAYQDAVYYFSSSDTLNQFARDPDAYLHPKDKDAKGKTAPQAKKGR